MFKNLILSSLLLLITINYISCDVYMHNPRGSNDRNCERNVNRNNANRLFDSQNNAKGGYACPRAVGDENTQNEAGIATINTGGTPIIQNKKMYYYEGSILPIEWTNQHGCGDNSKVNCEIIMQYMCEDTADPQIDNFWPWTEGKNNQENVGEQHFRSGSRIAAPRDGIPDSDDDDATDTIPDDEASAIPNTEATRRYGMHESYDFYQLCQHTSRNLGLYTSDQRVRRNDQRGTRQNPNGNRRGLECPEERDYYPHWSPTPWIDIAILTNEALCESDDDNGCPVCQGATCAGQARCTYYMANSMNVNKKYYCDVDHDTGDIQDKLTSSAWTNRQWYITQEECETNGFVWYGISHSDYLTDLDYPVCAQAGFSRVNQLGNAIESTVGIDINTADDDEDIVISNLNANRMVWTIPNIPTASTTDYFTGADGNGMEDAYLSCVLRLRYNISTSDFPSWPADATEDGLFNMVDSNNNSISDDNAGFNPLTQDPYVYIGPGDSKNTGLAFVSLAVNTNQYARTFQDRSYTFSIKPRPTTETAVDNDADTPYMPVVDDTTKIYNVNVRGKRGNIVQTYPAVEYDFVPNSLAIDQGDYVHFQWTGSDYNPRRGCNNAEGGPPDPNDFVSSANTNFNSRADRSNIIFMNTMAENLPMDMLGFDTDEYLDGMTTNEFTSLYSMAKATTIPNAPCYDGTTDDDDANDDLCYQQMIRLGYLNQQSDGGSLALRGDADCLTQDEIDSFSSKDQVENHPLNCAKMNAKPFPYFDGGLIQMNNDGSSQNNGNYFSYYSSRNNNFSNRDQTGIICIRSGTATCDVDPKTGVLQDINQYVSTAIQKRTSACEDTANSNSGANNNGAASCIVENDVLLDTESFTITEGDNDATGDGNKNVGCQEIIFFITNLSVAEKVGLAIGLLFVGIAASWGGYYTYNRYQRKLEGDSPFKGKAWRKPKESEMI